MTLFTLILLAAVGAEMIYPPTHQYFIHPDNKAAVVAYSNWDIQTPRHWQVDAQITCLDHEGMLRWMIMGWCKEYNLKDFAQLAKQWNPPKPEIFSTDPNLVVVMNGDKDLTAHFEKDPNTVEPVVAPIITFRISATTTEGGVYHLPSCRYVTDTAKTITIEQAELYRPCRVCKPDELDSLLAEFLPKTGVPNGQ